MRTRPLAPASNLDPSIPRTSNHEPRNSQLHHFRNIPHPTATAPATYLCDIGGYTPMNEWDQIAAEPFRSHQCMNYNAEGRRCRAYAVRNEYVCVRHRIPEEIINVVRSDPFELLPRPRRPPQRRPDPGRPRSSRCPPRRPHHRRQARRPHPLRPAELRPQPRQLPRRPPAPHSRRRATPPPSPRLPLATPPTRITTRCCHPERVAKRRVESLS
jgi:hypothetical protein